MTTETLKVDEELAKFEAWWEREEYDAKLRYIQGVMFNRIKNGMRQAWLARALLETSL
ncbi:hypothetical protein MUA04_00915 [Enterobacteriaceae bacterium H11S18]|uniref:hypothetical protein n=1 Tax=Dryocola clanedunensis TaxID=2925396 RepID=UPI0022F11BDD|nr:hypothetical protein [Dryocola clanedunensis]MCT4708797.1 hypothetical protein [Dryocola clanedunensis]